MMKTKYVIFAMIMAWNGASLMCSCGREPVEAPEATRHPWDNPGGDKPDVPSVDPEPAGRVEAMLANAELRFDWDGGAITYGDEGVLFMESVEGTRLEAVSLLTGAKAVVESPCRLAGLESGNVNTAERVQLDSHGWNLSVNEDPVEVGEVQLMQADGNGVWIRITTPAGRCYWIVVPREW